MVQNQICGLPHTARLTVADEGFPCPSGCPQKQERPVCVPERRLTPAHEHVKPCARGHSGRQGWLDRAELPHHGTVLRHRTTAPCYGTMLRHHATAPRYGTAQQQQVTPPCTTSSSRPAPCRLAAGLQCRSSQEASFRVLHPKQARNLPPHRPHQGRLRKRLHEEVR